MRALRSGFYLLVVVAATIPAGSGCHRPDEYQAVSPTNPSGFDAATALVVTATPPAIPGDGVSRTTIEAKISPDATLRHVTFQTSLGSLSAAGASVAAGTPTTMQADATGIARVDLISVPSSATAQVTVSVGSATPADPRKLIRSIDVPFTAADPGAVITLEPDALSAPADGATRIRLVARLSASVPSAQRTVTFTTSEGEFASNTQAGNKQIATVTADGSNLAIVELRSPTSIGTAAISATVISISAHATVSFVRAFPTTVFVQSSAPTVAAVGAANVTITVTLLRDVGKVTSNAVVTFEARDALGVLIGTFSSATLASADPTDPEGKRLVASATFTPVDTATLGVATITARCGSAAGTIQIQIN